MIFVGLFILGIGAFFLYATWFAATRTRDFFSVLFFGLLGVTISTVGFFVTLAAAIIT